VGEIGQNNGLESFGSDVNLAIKAFEKKFKDKTSNNWADRANFVPKSGKYTLIEMDTGAEEESTTTTAAASSPDVSISIIK
jgi:poly [ADP-ribose] polymerase